MTAIIKNHGARYTVSKKNLELLMKQESYTTVKVEYDWGADFPFLVSVEPYAGATKSAVWVRFENPIHRTEHGVRVDVT